MQNIHVRRYQQPTPGGYQGTVEPEDRSWIVFIDKDGHATFWRKAKIDPDPKLVTALGTDNVDHTVWYDVEATLSAVAAKAMLLEADEEPVAELRQNASP